MTSTSWKIGKRRTGGRNNTGRITVRHRGGGHKRLLRSLEGEERSGVIERIEYDPNRSAYIGECSGYKKKIIKILGGTKVEEQVKKEELIGTEIKVTKIKDVGVGIEVYGVGIKVGQIGKIGRAAGVRCVVIKQGRKTTTIRMPSGSVKEVQRENVCTIGRVYSEKHVRKGKAGANRRIGWRPTVKGVCMNPVDHPGGRQPKTPYGKLAKFVPTRKARKVRR